MSKKRSFSLDSSRVERHWIALKGTLTSKNFNCLLINVYNPCTMAHRALIWQELLSIYTASMVPCLLVGDFNEVLAPQDRGSHHFDPLDSSYFNALIQELSLLEIPASNGFFTWFRGGSKSKLDPLLVQSEWISLLPDLRVSLLNRLISDHRPLLISPNNNYNDWGLKPFRFLDCWLSHKGCLEMISNSWLTVHDLSLMSKLQAVKGELKKWNLRDFGSIDTNIARFEKEIQHWDVVADERNLTEDELKLRNIAQVNLWE